MTVYARVPWSPEYRGSNLRRDGTLFTLSSAGWAVLEEEEGEKFPGDASAEARRDDDGVTVTVNARGKEVEIRFRNA